MKKVFMRSLSRFLGCFFSAIFSKSLYIVKSLLNMLLSMQFYVVVFDIKAITFYVL